MTLDAFEFKNIDVSEDLKIFANRCLDRLREAAPYLTTFVASLEQRDGKYVCSIEMYSHWGHFKASSSTLYPEAAIIWTEHKINSRLWSWKEKRFSNLEDDNAFIHSQKNKHRGGSSWDNESHS